MHRDAHGNEYLTNGCLLELKSEVISSIEDYLDVDSRVKLEAKALDFSRSIVS